MSDKITLAAVFYNEAQKLPGYFKNVRGVVDDMIVVDCSSKDGTAEICRKNGAKVITSPYRYLEQNLNLIFPLVKTEWVLLLDADERLSPEMKISVREAAKKGGADIYVTRRINYLFEGFSYQAKYNNCVTKLFRKNAVRWETEMPDENPKKYGVRKNLPGYMLHYPHPSILDWMKKTEDYLRNIPIEFGKKNQKQIYMGEKVPLIALFFGVHGFRRLFLYPIFHIFNYLVRHRMILDGVRGVIFSICQGMQVFIEEASYYERSRKQKYGLTFDWSREYPDRE